MPHLRTQTILTALLISCPFAVSAAQSPKTRLALKPNAPHARGAAGRGGAPTPATATVTVTVRAESEVAGAYFTLGEIAEIKGADSGLVARLAAVQVGVSPLAGLSRMIMPGDVIVHIRAYHLDSKSIEVIAPSDIRIRRAGHEVSNNQIAQAAIAAAQSAIKDLPDAALELVPLGSAVTIPAGNVHIVAGAYRGQPEQGSLTVPVSLIVNGQTIQTVEVTLRVHRKLKALVATRTIQPHDIISAEDIALLTVELPPGFAQPVVDPKEAIGKRATKRIMADSPLPADALEVPPAIEANSKVTITFMFGAVRITAPGLSRQAGKIGDTIRVYAIDTRKELDAVIVDDHTVRVTDENGS